MTASGDNLECSITGILYGYVLFLTTIGENGQMTDMCIFGDTENSVSI